MSLVGLHDKEAVTALGKAVDGRLFLKVVAVGEINGAGTLGKRNAVTDEE